MRAPSRLSPAINAAVVRIYPSAPPTKRIFPANSFIQNKKGRPNSLEAPFSKSRTRGLLPFLSALLHIFLLALFLHFECLLADWFAGRGATALNPLPVCIRAAAQRVKKNPEKNAITLKLELRSILRA